MTARLVLPHDAPEADWLAERRQGVTASEIAALLGISPYESPFSLYWRKRGDIPDQLDNDAMSLGRHLEPWIADRFAEAHPEWDVDLAGLFGSIERPWQMATPDRMLYKPYGTWQERTGLLEIKHSGTYDGWGDDGTDEIPVHYRAQVLWQLDVLGVREAYVCCLFLSSRQVRTYRIAYDAADVELMRKAACEFLDRLAADDPPPIDAHDATTYALKYLNPGPLDDGHPASVDHPTAEEYRAACRRLATAEAVKKQLSNEIRSVMGDAKRVVDDADGSAVLTRSVYAQTGLDRDRLRREFPDAWAACRTTSTVDKLTAAKPKGGTRS